MAVKRIDKFVRFIDSINAPASATALNPNGESESA
tara:strand:- start:385 stop:489 length:105 start_codon:yes stop_codon:yes gene_type:complete